MGCGVTVPFNYNSFIARYPEFSAIPEATLAEYYVEATLYWANDGTSPASNVTIQGILMNKVTAHIAALYSQSQGDTTPGAPKDANSPVGRIASASEGSVSVTLQYEVGQAGQWFAQTKYGADFWASTAKYRTARYIRGAIQPGGLTYGFSGPSRGFGSGRF